MSHGLLTYREGNSSSVENLELGWSLIDRSFTDTEILEEELELKEDER